MLRWQALLFSLLDEKSKRLMIDLINDLD